MASELSGQGRSSSGFQSKSGPFHQRELSTRFCAVRPREASSAGFNYVSTYFHWSGDVRSLICWTRLATKVWKRRASLEM